MFYTLQEIRSIPILFVVGKGRSGTTLLSNILDSHPKVASATESRFLLILWQRYKNMKTWKPNMALEFYNTVQLDLHVKTLWTFKDDFIDALKKLPEETTVAELIKMVYLFRQSDFDKGKITHIVDKNPMFTLFIDRIKGIFPEAKFYRLMRDPRDNITSHLRYNDHHYGVLAYKWYDFNKRIDQFANRFPSDVYTQNFENLILDKNGFFKKFGEFTGIKNLANLEEERLKYKDELTKKFNDQLKDQHKASIKPLDKSKIGHFKTKLTKEQITVIESLCFPYAANYGYEAIMNVTNAPALKKWAWQTKHYGINALSFTLYNLPFPFMKMLSNFFAKKNNL